MATFFRRNCCYSPEECCHLPGVQFWVKWQPLSIEWQHFFTIAKC
jgi:hypothetical protein